MAIVVIFREGRCKHDETQNGHFRRLSNLHINSTRLNRGINLINLSTSNWAVILVALVTFLVGFFGGPYFTAYEIIAIITELLSSSPTNGCFLQWWYPQIIHSNRFFHYFHHPFWGIHIFWKHPNPLNNQGFRSLLNRRPAQLPGRWGRRLQCRSCRSQATLSAAWMNQKFTDSNIEELMYTLKVVNLYWLVVSTHLKNFSQIGNLPQVGMKIKNVWNHHPVYFVVTCIYSWKFQRC